MASEMANMNLAITVDDGSRRVPIINKQGKEIGAFTFHPTDIGIIQRYNALAEDFGTVMAPLEAIAGDDGIADISDPRCAEALTEAGERLYAAVDKLLGCEGAAVAFFGNMSPFSPINGEFYCTQVLNAVGMYIGAAFDTETAQFTDKAKKYAKKAARK